jgi:glycosyltransferase involved in cell wall biosynthesis
MDANQRPAPQLVSVVIPCYNQATYLAQAIESVQRQTHPFIEITVLDDGSTDETVAVASRYESVRCVTQRNQGPSAARNEGLKYASAEYVVFLDADDRLLPPAIETALRHFAAHPEVALVAGRCIAIDARGVQQQTHHDSLVERDHYLRLLATNYIWTPGSVMFRTAVLRSVGGFARALSAGEDYALYLRIAKDHPIFCHDLIVIEYRQHGSSASREPMKMMRSLLHVMDSQHRLVKGDPLAERALRDGIKHWQTRYGDQVMDAVRKQLRAREWRQALPSLLGLLYYHPHGFFHHARRKLSRIAHRHKPESLETIG